MEIKLLFQCKRCGAHLGDVILNEEDLGVRIVITKNCTKCGVVNRDEFHVELAPASEKKVAGRQRR